MKFEIGNLKVEMVVLLALCLVLPVRGQEVLRWEDDAGEPVRMRWWQAEEASPGCLVVHSLDPEQRPAEMAAQMLADIGVHAFVVDLPGFGERGDAEGVGVQVVRRPERAVADVQAALARIQALPQMQEKPLVVLGLSMGGPMAYNAVAGDAHVAGLFLLATGADAARVLDEGLMDAQWLADRLRAAGMESTDWHQRLDPHDPVKQVRTLSTEKISLHSATLDGVFPEPCVQALARACGLEAEGEKGVPAPGRHTRFEGNHYGLMGQLPAVVEAIQTHLTQISQ